MSNKCLGFKDGDRETIVAVLKKYSQIEQAVIFGSRATGVYQPGSDVDLVLKGRVQDVITEISFSLNEDSLLPYKFDVIDYNTISNQKLIDHINKVGIVFYEKNRSPLWYAIAILVVIGVGLSSRHLPALFPRFLGKYPGDGFWALMVFLVWGFIFPRISTARLALYAMVTCCLDECSQLYQAPWIDVIRSTTLGRLVLGNSFLWGDFIAYAIGVGAGALGEITARSIITARTKSASRQG